MTNIKVATFKGMAPRLNKRLLPNDFAQAATNCYLRSGALEAIRGPSTAASQPTKSGNIKTIYGFDRDDNDNLKWLHWTDTDPAHQDGRAGIVEVAKGFIVGDTDERYYYTGTNYPRETTTNLAQLGGGGNYPTTSYRLGTPNPTVTPAVDQRNPDTIIYSDLSDGSSLSQWTVSPTINNGSRQQSVTVDPTGGTTGDPGFNFSQSGLFSPQDPAAYIFRDVGLQPFTYAGLKTDIKFFNTTNDAVAQMIIGATTSSGGIMLYITKPGSTSNRVDFQLGLHFGWGGNGITYSTGATSLNDLGFNASAYFTVEFFINNNREITYYSVKVTQGSNMYTIALPPPAFNFNSGFEGGVVGVGINTVQTTAVHVNFDNIGYFSAETDNAVLTNYVYTLVSEKDGIEEESAPSPASANITTSDNVGVDISDIATPSAFDIDQFNIIKKYLYRAVTGSVGTVYQFVAEIPLFTTTYSDTIDTEDLEPTFLESIGWELPPEDGRYITALPNGIMLIASDRDICPSVAFRPHAYPFEYRLSVDYKIVGIGVLTSSVNRNNEGTAVIVTEGGAYILTGDSPATMILARISGSPAGYEGRSIAYWREYGVVYASLTGLIAISPEGALNLTEAFADNRKWLNFNPKTTLSVFSDETYFGFTDSGGYSFQKDIGLVNLTPGVQCLWHDPKLDVFYYISPGTANLVQKWAGDVNTPLPMSWSSKAFTDPYPVAYEGAQVFADNAVGTYPACVLQIYRNEEVVPYYTRNVTSDNEFTIGMKPAKVTEFTISSSGGGIFNSVELAEDLMDLS